MLLTRSEDQARWEQALGLAHARIYSCKLFAQSHDDYELADDLQGMLDVLADLIENSIKRGRRLRTRP